MAVPTQHWTLIQAVAAKIVAAVVSGRIVGVAEASVRPRKLAAFNDFSAAASLAAGFFSFPGILACLWSTEQYQPATNANDDKLWPVLVAFGCAEDASNIESDNSYFDNRATVADLFQHQSFLVAAPAVEYWNCEVEFGPILDPAWYQQKGLILGTLGLRFYERRNRG
jgi:hypothetical protein